jgi:hypothetical protein
MAARVLQKLKFTPTPFLLFLLARGALAQPPAASVTVPRILAEATVDGRLDEPAWAQAARLDSFRQFRPVDARPAEERTEVLVWYSPSALHFGILAFDRDPGTVRATVADRDNLERDDTVTIYLDTFLDRRRAFFFGVNPLGSQEDGVFSEGQFNPGTMMGGSTDRNPDYLFDSKGRLTPEGYVVEIRIPFKSLRYPAGDVQRWGLNVLRKVQRTGYEDTWTDTRRAASFLAQSGILEGLHDLERGVVLAAQPFVTGEADGARTAGGFERGGLEPDAGASLRLAFTNLSVDATVNPDFSQVESDAGLVTVNERFALFYPEKRPFFLEGIELFATPNQLVYTRRIADPIGGGKVTGKLGRVAVAALSAVDDTDEGNAWFNLARVRTDLGADSVAGVTVTDRTLDGGRNTVLAADARYVFGKMYYLQGQAGGSWTRDGGGGDGGAMPPGDATVAAPVWLAEFDRTGRSWGFNYKLTGIGEGFDAQAGFVPRTDVVEGRAFNRLTVYGDRGAAVESVSLFAGPTRYWRHAGYPDTRPIEGNEYVNVTAQARGGWNLNGGARRSFYVLDAADYEGLQTRDPTGALVPYAPLPRLDGLWEWSAGVTTPTWRRLNAGLSLALGGAPLFDEGAEGRQARASASLGLRPTPSIRATLSLLVAHLARESGGEFARTVLPRAKIEYQPSRAWFFRVVGELRDERVAALEDARTGAPLYEAGAPAAASRSRTLRVDWLFAYEPSPGTVVYVGYGSTHDAPDARRSLQLERASDGLFLKIAYLFRR